MSLILDALNKIERDKRRAAEGGSEVGAVSRSRFGSRQNWLPMGAMAIGSALLTAAAVSFLNGRHQSPTPVAEEASAALIARSDALPESEVPEPETSQPPSPAVPVVEDESAREPAPLPVRAAKPEAQLSAELDIDEARRPRSDGVDSVDPTTLETMEPLDPADEADPISQPIRLVGQERVLLDALNVERPGSVATASTEDTEPLLEDFPKLVLQGTSVMGGNAVAVISDQRVFEGDRVEGALVVRIGEREVELEVDGKRFLLRL